MANMLVLFVTMLVVLVEVYQVSSLGVGPCACYKLSMTAMDTCQKRPPPVFTLTGAKLTLQDDCTLVPEGCLAYTPFNASSITVTLTKPFLSETTTYKVDGCKVMSILPPELLTLLKTIKSDFACPVVTANKFCAVPPLTNFNVAIVPFYLESLEMLSKLGPMTGMFKAVHGVNMKSCIRLIGEVKRDPACPVLGMTTPTVPTLPTLPTISLSSLDTTLPTIPTLPTVPTIPTVPTVPTLPTIGFP